MFAPTVSNDPIEGDGEVVCAAWDDPQGEHVLQFRRENEQAATGEYAAEAIEARVVDAVKVQTGHHQIRARRLASSRSKHAAVDGAARWGGAPVLTHDVRWNEVR